MPPLPKVQPSFRKPATCTPIIDRRQLKFVPKTHKYKAVGAYIFAGGFTVGVSRKFNVLCHLEESDYGVATARFNFDKLPIHYGPDKWPIEDLAGEKIDFLYGNPPCAAWSVAGYTKTRGTDKWRTDPRVACTEKHFGLLKALRPKVWAWESVTQAFTKGREFCDKLAEEAAELGYATTFILHDSQWFGLPQTRKRFFMVCHNITFSPITPNFGQPPTPLQVLRSVKSGEPCFGKDGKGMDCGLAKRFTQKVISKVRPGQRLTSWWKDNVADPDPEKWERNPNGTVKGRPSYGHCRLPIDKPSGAVVGYAMIHPTEHRFLSTEEMQVLSGFPPTYYFTPNTATKRASEIARGVCPPVGEWLADSVRMCLEIDRPIEAPFVKLVDLRKPGIEPEILMTWGTI